jgi:hypothetical protein
MGKRMNRVRRAQSTAGLARRAGSLKTWRKESLGFRVKEDVGMSYLGNDFQVPSQKFPPPLEGVSES